MVVLNWNWEDIKPIFFLLSWLHHPLPSARMGRLYLPHREKKDQERDKKRGRPAGVAGAELVKTT
jgi:hypothetical protein